MSILGHVADALDARGLRRLLSRVCQGRSAQMSAMVGSDNYLGGLLAGRHLIAQGCQPIAQAGAALVDMLMQVIKGKRPDSNLLPTELIVCIDL